ncbi:MAG: VWA domain-containing protein, partial [Alistipes sp.]|nr:VWA domain-containing protein [Alistipes sp.]
FGNAATLQSLMPEYNGVRGWIKIALFSLAVGFLALALARPQTGSKLRTTEVEGREVVLVVDVSNSMLAEDVTPSRIERTRYAISRLVERMKEDRLGIVAFAEEAEVVLPITGDYKMAEAMVKRLSPSLIAHQGTDIGEALEVALLSFTDSTKESKSRVIILITDGEEHNQRTEAAIEQAVAEGVMVCAIGIGTPEGTPLKINGELIEDEDGKMVVTKLGEPLLQHIAEATGGIYTRSRNDNFGLEDIITRLDEIEATQLTQVTFEEYDEQYQWFLGAALLLLIAEIFVMERRNPLLRGVRLFDRESK